MILDALAQPIEYAALLRLLRIRAYGAPASYDEQYFYVHDPHLETGPTQVSHGDLELAWLEHDYRYAVIRRSSASAAKA